MNKAQSPSSRQPYVLLELNSRNTLICKSVWFCEGLTWKPAESPVFLCLQATECAASGRSMFQLLKLLRKPTTGFALLGAHQRHTLVCKQICFENIINERFSWVPVFTGDSTEPVVYDVSSTECAAQRPPHVSFGTIFEISQHFFIKETTHNLQTIEQGSKTPIRISFTKLNIHLLLERVSLNFSGDSLTVIQIQANPTKRLRQFLHCVYTCIAMSRISYQLEHEAAWCSTFNCLGTSQTRDSAGFQCIAYIHVSRCPEYRTNWNMRRPGAAHSVARENHKREIQLGLKSKPND
ncbi:hypothetical protein CSKR_114388 [Clonorchis sinensis]|uniref:Uncharacterized protein n=1 Tax=Clonorchis sinensis TaxID=79923 RepID=A0A3R7FML0_CLOSI|nr:hypothetical protein CSKR_114388 [Clonorchis sinensis]